MIHSAGEKGDPAKVSNCNADKITYKVQLGLAVNQMHYIRVV